MDEVLRKNLREVDFEQLRQQWEDTLYRELVQEHLRKTGPRLSPAVQGIILALSEDELEALNLIWQEYYQRACTFAFWSEAKATDILNHIISLYEKELRNRHLVPENKLLFAAFQFVTLNFAGIALASKEFRKAAGIRKGFFFA